MSSCVTFSTEETSYWFLGKPRSLPLMKSFIKINQAEIQKLCMHALYSLLGDFSGGVNWQLKIFALS